LAGKSAEKQVRVSGRREKRNQSILSEVKTNITRAEKLVSSGQLEEARRAVITAASSMDKAAGKKVLHPGNTARRKSRLVKKLNAAVASPPAKSQSK
jgi:small subunit ribosomal protein S20